MTARALLITLAALVLGVAANTAQAQAPSTANVVFIVDESGSMAGEQAFLQNIIGDLDAALTTAGVGTTTYGVVGFGGTNGSNTCCFGQGARDASGGLVGLGDAQTALNGLITSGGFEDGYQAIDFALNTYNLTGEAVNFILVTDEDRDVGVGSLDAAAIETALTAEGILLNAIINARNFSNPGVGGGLVDGDGNIALGIDSSGDAYLADGAGGFTTSAGGQAVSGAGTTIADYVDVALNTGGAAWDLNQLRAGISDPLLADSFAASFLAIKVQEITEVTVPEPGTLGLLGLGLLGLGAVRRRRS